MNILVDLAIYFWIFHYTLGTLQQENIIEKFLNWNNEISSNIKIRNISARSNEDFENFEENYSVIQQQRIKFIRGESKFLMGPNIFSGLNAKQKSTLNGLVLDPIFDIDMNLVLQITGRTARPQYPTPPASLDYRDMGYVTNVQDSGPYCSSCYAFAATCAMEGQIAKKYGRLPDLSEQNIVDCSQVTGNNGCYGGSFSKTYRYIIKNRGIANETTYPYTGDIQACRYNSSLSAERAYSFAFVTGNESNLKSALAAIGPLAVGIRGDLESFLYYESGIYDDPRCNSIINHAGCLVGYGTDITTTPPTDYWIIKNSWSEYWGENGYMRLKMGSNLCGISNYVVYPKV